MKRIALALIIWSCGIAYAQERVSPLLTNPNIYKEVPLTRTSESNSIDSTFIYEYTAMDLEDVWDDFSINKFNQEETEFAGPGISSDIFYRLMDETNTTPLDPDLIYCDAEFARHDTVKFFTETAVVETVTHYPFTEYDIWVNDLDFYPVEGELITGVYQECYVLIDSIIDGVLDTDQDTIFYNIPPGPAYCQDSARVFTKVVSDPNILWVDNFACHNYTFAVDPWSLGVATFDGVDENGRPYEFGVEGSYGVADYLTSRPINLNAAADSEDDIYLTFIYQAKGYGNMPETEDSLVLEFWNQDLDDEIGGWISQDQWLGLADDVEPNQWDTAHVLLSPGFNNDTVFRFRIKNYASLSGALDHWHIDYVKLAIQGVADSDGASFDDLAISEPINTLLKDYTAVPWDHYKNNASGNEYMLDEVNFVIHNSFFNEDPDEIESNYSGGEWAIEKDGVLQGGSPYTIFTDAILPALNLLGGPVDCNVPVASDYFYDPGFTGPQAAFGVGFNFLSSAGPNRNFTKINDTTHFTQRFDNYYAYDDGSPEAAYGIDGTGSLMAYKFEAYEAGALTGILMHFVPSVTDFSDEVFLLTVWADNDGEPGEIIYQDDFFQSHSPQYSGSKTGFKYYKFFNNEYAVVPDGCDSCLYLPVGETFYIGWQNISDFSLNVGMDFNIDNGDKIFRNTAGEWLTSSFEASLLIRPVFSTALDYTLSNGGGTILEADDRTEINMYPNPATDFITLSGLPETYALRIFDMSGRMVTFVENEHQIDVSHLEKGVYMVDVRTDEGESIFSSRLIKR